MYAAASSAMVCLLVEFQHAKHAPYDDMALADGKYGKFHRFS